MISIIATVVIVGYSVSKYVNMRTDDLLRLVCLTRQETLDNYFSSIMQSVDTVANYAEQDLEEKDADISEHLRKTDQLFRSVASNTRGTLTYYYRIAPEITRDETGFWYQKGEDGDFAQSEMTVLENYDADNISRVGWYYLPKQTGDPVWMEPYDNENMGVRMISYVSPVYRNGEFFGVVGMDFSYEDLVAHMGEVDEFYTGYTFLTDKDGSIIYHKEIEAGTSLNSIAPETITDTASGEDGNIIRYSYNGVRKRASSAVLSNKMRLYVTVSESEIISRMKRLITILVLSALSILALFILFTSLAVRRITHPLSRLTEAAAAFDRGDYDVEVNYDGDDEIGILTNTFKQMRDHIGSRLGSLNDMAYKDSLTSIRNKSAFDNYSEQLDERINSSDEVVMPEFAVCMFDCNDLKEINDTYGHDRGDQYLKATCRLICDVFSHSAVFRTGGDEFIAILQNEDYRERDDVCRTFTERAESTLREDNAAWDRISVAMGIAVFDPVKDTCTADVLKRADELMYDDKSRIKKSDISSEL